MLGFADMILGFSFIDRNGDAKLDDCCYCNGDCCVFKLMSLFLYRLRAK
mgnify:FL=1